MARDLTAPGPQGKVDGQLEGRSSVSSLLSFEGIGRTTDARSLKSSITLRSLSEGGSSAGPIAQLV
jgi:hypothetical protein